MKNAEQSFYIAMGAGLAFSFYENIAMASFLGLSIGAVWLFTSIILDPVFEFVRKRLP